MMMCAHSVCFSRHCRGVQSDYFRFFSNFLWFWYQKKAHIFLINPGEKVIAEWQHPDCKVRLTAYFCFFMLSLNMIQIWRKKHDMKKTLHRTVFIKITCLIWFLTFSDHRPVVTEWHSPPPKRHSRPNYLQYIPSPAGKCLFQYVIPNPTGYWKTLNWFSSYAVSPVKTVWRVAVIPFALHPCFASMGPWLETERSVGARLGQVIITFLSLSFIFHSSFSSSYGQKKIKIWGLTVSKHLFLVVYTFPMLLHSIFLAFVSFWFDWLIN